MVVDCRTVTRCAISSPVASASGGVVTYLPKPAGIASCGGVVGIDDNGDLIGASHIQFPGLGHLRASGKKYQWVPVNFTQMR